MNEVEIVTEVVNIGRFIGGYFDLHNTLKSLELLYGDDIRYMSSRRGA